MILNRAFHTSSLLSFLNPYWCLDWCNKDKQLHSDSMAVRQSKEGIVDEL